MLATTNNYGATAFQKKYASSRLGPTADGSSESPPAAASTTGKRKASVATEPQANFKLRKYHPDFLQYGFTCIVKNNVEYPQCVICSEVLAQESLKQVKLKRQLETNHTSYVNKPLGFFRRKEEEQQSQKTVVSEYATKKPHTIAESLIRPAAIAMTRATGGQKIAGTLQTIPLSNDTMGRASMSWQTTLKSNLWTE